MLSKQASFVNGTWEQVVLCFLICYRSMGDFFLKMIIITTSSRNTSSPHCFELKDNFLLHDDNINLIQQIHRFHSDVWLSKTHERDPQVLRNLTDIFTKKKNVIHNLMLNPYDRHPFSKSSRSRSLSPTFFFFFQFFFTTNTNFFPSYTVLICFRISSVFHILPIGFFQRFSYIPHKLELSSSPLNYRTWHLYDSNTW